jgi:hypothetical protein
MAGPLTESARLGRHPNFMFGNLISIDSFQSPERPLAPLGTKKHHSRPAGKREQAVIDGMMMIPSGPGN